MQKTMFMFCIFLLLSAGCTEKQEGKGSGAIINIVEVPIISLDNIEILTDPSKKYPFPNNDCVDCSWYFCPPMTSVWQKELCIDYCLDPPAVVHEGECSEYLQCDPTQYLMEEIDCITEEGFPGVQDKVCNKGDDAIDEDLINPCANACGSGYEICQNGNWVSCSAPPEKEEICDGFDNDCDGKIDEDLECMCTLQDVGVLFPCQEDPLICGQGFKTCECTDPDCTTFSMTECFALCYWVPINDPTECDPLVGMELEQEKCNNFDDNCNQKIDEDLYTACYTGPEGTLLVGICEPGTMTCEAGTWGRDLQWY